MQKTTESSPKNTICSSGIRCCIKHLSSTYYGQDTVQKTTWCPSDSLLSTKYSRKTGIGKFITHTLHMSTHIVVFPLTSSLFGHTMSMTNGSKAWAGSSWWVCVSCCGCWIGLLSASGPAQWAPTTTYFAVNAFVLWSPRNQAHRISFGFRTILFTK